MVLLTCIGRAPFEPHLVQLFADTEVSPLQLQASRRRSGKKAEARFKLNFDFLRRSRRE